LEFVPQRFDLASKCFVLSLQFLNALLEGAESFRRVRLLLIRAY